MFELGEEVVHPQYGVGRIVKLEDREFERGSTRQYYEILIPGGSTIWVQRNSAMVRPVVSLVTVASQTCVWRPR
jgi:RNA polymerase-interacting CarD/CdnL/TRCF family regulator